MKFATSALLLASVSAIRLGSKVQEDQQISMYFQANTWTEYWYINGSFTNG